MTWLLLIISTFLENVSSIAHISNAGKKDWLGTKLHGIHKSTVSKLSLKRNGKKKKKTISTFDFYSQQRSER